MQNAETLARLLRDTKRRNLIVVSFQQAAVARFHELVPRIDLAPGIVGAAAWLAGGSPGPGVVAFQQYRINILESTDPANDRPQLAEIQLFSTVVPEPSALIGVMTLAPLGLLYRRRRSPEPK